MIIFKKITTVTDKKWNQQQVFNLRQIKSPEDSLRNQKCLRLTGEQPRPSLLMINL